MRVLVVTSTYPTPSRPGLGGFVRDQVDALREIDGLELELFTYERGAALLPCGVNLDRFGPRDRRDARGRLGIDPSGRYLLFPADPARPEKRHDRARGLAAAAGAELLTYAGAPPERIPDLINAANAVIATSEREGFGLAPLEAL